MTRAEQWHIVLRVVAAEQLGNLPYHGFLKRFIEDITTSAVRFGAEVHRYVGDEVILTWDERKGLEEGNCVNAVFAMTEALELASDSYAADFGVVPRFWAGLHLGPVVTGEIGTVKHEIANLGDTLNTAARIEQACREFQRPFVASRDVIQAVDLPHRVSADSLGEIELRGLGSSVELLAVTKDTGHGRGDR